MSQATLSGVAQKTSFARGTLYLTLALGGKTDGETRAPTLREAFGALADIQRACDLGWTGIPLDTLIGEHRRSLPALPRYDVLRIEMASPLEIALGIPKEVLSIPVALAGLALAVEHVLNCPVRIRAKRETLEAERIEALERRLSAEARIQERFASAQSAWGSRATSAEIHLKEDELPPPQESKLDAAS